MKRYALPLAVLLALAGCSASDRPTDGGYPEGGQAAVEAEASANEGENEGLIDASETAEWDNGLTARITAVTSEPTTHYQHVDKGHDTIITITVEIANTGDEAFAFAANRYTGPGGPSDALFYGVNMYDAQGWANVDGDGVDDLPKQLVPGTSATFSEEWSLPGAEADVLTFEFTPDRETLMSFYFTDVQTLIQ